MSGGCDVFVGYSAQDRERVRNLVERLHSHGLCVLWDPRSPSIRPRPIDVRYELTACRSTVVPWTPTWTASGWVPVGVGEDSRHGYVVPVHFDQTSVPLDFSETHAGNPSAWGGSPAHLELHSSPGMPIDGADSSDPVSRDYLEAVLAANRWMGIGWMMPGALDSTALEGAYTQLRSRGTAAPEEPGEPAKPRKTVEDVLGANSDAVLLGGPGSGKTTVLRWILRNVVRAHLGEPERLAEMGLDGPAPFPIHVDLAPFAGWLERDPSHRSGDVTLAHFYRGLDALQDHHAWGLPAGYLADRVRAGGCLLLFDGLDQVPESIREWMTGLIANVIGHGRSCNNRHLITCRTRAWHELMDNASLPPLGGGEAILELAPMRWPEVEALWRSWVEALPGPTPDIAWSDRANEIEAYRERVLGDLRVVPRAPELASTPLIAALMAAIHWSGKTVPRHRAALLRTTVGNMLDARQHAATEAGFTSDRRRSGLRAAARLMLRSATDEGGRVPDFEDTAQEVAGALGIELEEARTYLSLEMEWSGLLTRSIDGQLVFAHALVGEYLVAEALSEDEERTGERNSPVPGWEALDPHLYEAAWSEVVPLYAGCRLLDKGPGGVRQMITRVLEGSGLSEPRPNGVVGRVLSSVRRRFEGRDRTSEARAVRLVDRLLAEVRSDDPVADGELSEGTAYRAMREEVQSPLEPGQQPVSGSRWRGRLIRWARRSQPTR